MRVLVLVAHPDDEVIMCGASIQKWVRSGATVNVCFFTRNEQAYFGEELQENRLRRAVSEAETAAQVLGHTVQFAPFADMELDQHKGLVIQKTIDVIRECEPDIIVTHHAGDKHIDHRVLGEIVPEANFQSGCQLCGGEKVWSAAAVLQGEIDLEMTGQFEYNVVSAVSSDNLAAKGQAFRRYESVSVEHNTTDDWTYAKLDMVALLRGRAVGIGWGEAFILSGYSPLNSAALRKVSEAIA